MFGRVIKMIQQKVKVANLAFLLVGTSGCSEFACYSNIDYVKNQSDKFCVQGNNNKQLCESLKIAEENICKMSIENKNDCVSSGYGLEMFIRIPYSDCVRIAERDICNAKQPCKWSFRDPMEMKFDK